MVADMRITALHVTEQSSPSDIQCQKIILLKHHSPKFKATLLNRPVAYFYSSVLHYIITISVYAPALAQQNLSV